MRLSPHPAFHRLCYQAFNQSPIESCLDLRQLCGGTQVVDFGQLFSCYSQLFADALESGSVLDGQQWKIPSVEQHQIAVYINLRESERALSFIRNFRVFRICRLKERFKNLQNHFCVYFCNQGKTEQDPQHGYPQENIREKRQQQERK